MNYGIVRDLCNIYQYTCIKHATKAYGETNETNKTFEVIFQSLMIHNFLSNINTYNIDRIRTTEVEATDIFMIVKSYGSNFPTLYINAEKPVNVIKGI